jgi:predicted nucleic acid-binding protein
VKYLLDTCVLSELANPRPNAKVVDWLQRQDSNSLYLSAVTIGELEKGIEKRGDDVRARKLASWLRTDILGSFEDRILPVGREVALEWGRICGAAERIGRKRPAVDALIAATAVVHQLVLVTRNVTDMDGMGAPLFNPFEEG